LIINNLFDTKYLTELILILFACDFIFNTSDV